MSKFRAYAAQFCAFICVFFPIQFSNAVPEDLLTIGITPWQKGLSSDDINKNYLPLLKWLSEKTGKHYRIKQMESYDSTVSEIAKGSIQIAMLSPGPYVKAKKANPKLELLVTEQSWNHDKTAKADSYRSHILVLKSNKQYTNMATVKGKKFAFVAEPSTSGFLVPMAHFKANKIDPKIFFSKVSMLGSHPGVTDALVSGEIDAGATWDFNWAQAVKKHGDVFKEIWTSEAIPNLCIVAHEQVPTDLQAKIRYHLINVPSHLLTGLSAVSYVRREDSFYDSVRMLYQ